MTMSKHEDSETATAPPVRCTDLLACPFCGGEAVMEEIENLGFWRKSVGCKTEGCQGYQSSTTFATHREATRAWNTRKQANICTECQREKTETEKERP